MGTKRNPHARLPNTVWALGFTSLFMDISSELIHGLLPVFLVVTLGASAAALGVIEGIAEATAHITRVFSGATVGPLLAIGLMYLFNYEIRTVLWFAVIPAAISVTILVLLVEEPARVAHKNREPIKFSEVKGLGSFYWFVVVAGAVFTLARFSEAFLVIRAHDQGLGVGLTPAFAAHKILRFRGLTEIQIDIAPGRFGLALLSRINFFFTIGLLIKPFY